MAVHAHLMEFVIPTPEWLMSMSWMPLMATCVVAFCHGGLISIIMILQNEILPTDIRWNCPSMIPTKKKVQHFVFSFKEYFSRNSQQPCKHGICIYQQNFPYSRGTIEFPWRLLCLWQHSLDPHYLGHRDNENNWWAKFGWDWKTIQQ